MRCCRIGVSSICNRAGRVIPSPILGGHAMSDRDSGNSFMGFWAGLGFGALVGVLYPPRPGRETRDAIKNSAQQGKEYLKTRGREARENVNEGGERGKDLVGRRKTQL